MTSFQPIADTETALRIRNSPELSIIVPTFNERENVLLLHDKLVDVLGDIHWEVIFVDDDSSDGTHSVVRQLAQSDSRVRIIHRVDRRGLASAVVEGILSTSSDFVAVMDADLQHDERILPQMFEKLQNQEFDLVIGSRYVSDGGVGTWSAYRVYLSRIATRLATFVAGHDIRDPMSGFFMMKREYFDISRPKLSSRGFKILLDIIMSAPRAPRFREVPYVFSERQYGESKIEPLVLWEYVHLLLEKTVGRFVPVRFLIFAAMGGLGVVIHMAVLFLLFKKFGLNFSASQTTAALAAMTFNFFLNNSFTYRDRRIKGFWKTLLGLASFYLVCLIGMVSNVGIASYLFVHDYRWWISGIAGILVGAVWNYAASSVFTWGR